MPSLMTWECAENEFFLDSRLGKWWLTFLSTKSCFWHGTLNWPWPFPLSTCYVGWHCCTRPCTGPHREKAPVWSCGLVMDMPRLNSIGQFLFGTIFQSFWNWRATLLFLYTQLWKSTAWRNSCVVLGDGWQVGSSPSPTTFKKPRCNSTALEPPKAPFWE